MKILAIDTSSKNSSIALIQNEKTIFEFNINNNITHSQSIMPMLKTALELSQINIKEIDLFAVTTGPGSFTGIRIGISAVKGLAMGLKKPCIGISSLSSLAFNVNFFDGIICCTIDAKCGNVYNAIYLCKNREIENISEDRLISIHDLSEELKKYNKHVMVIGDAKNNFSDIKNVILSPDISDIQSATSLAMIANLKYIQNPNLKNQTLIPSYVNMSSAEKNYLKNKENIT